MVLNAASLFWAPQFQTMRIVTDLVDLRHTSEWGLRNSHARDEYEVRPNPSGDGVLVSDLVDAINDRLVARWKNSLCHIRRGTWQ